MLIRDFSERALVSCLRGDGLHLVIGAFTIQLQIALPGLVADFARMYAHYPVQDPPEIDDARVRIAAPSLLSRYLTPQAKVWTNGNAPFEPVPADRAFTLLESAFNWVVASNDLAPLLIHSAVLERDGRALIMPAPSGSGKSTLCAALAWRGWRLLSDEMGVFSLHDGRLHANPRPVSLKNRAIEVIAAFAPGATLSRTYRGTPRGDVAYMQIPPEALARSQETALPSLIVAPAYLAGSPTVIKPLSKIDGFRLLTGNAVNYSTLLRTGFDLVTGLLEGCARYALTYSDLEEAIALIDELHHAPALVGRNV